MIKPSLGAASDALAPVLAIVREAQATERIVADAAAARIERTALGALEDALPPELAASTRLMRDIDVLMGPEQTLLQAMTLVEPALAALIQRVHAVCEVGFASRFSAARRRAARALRAEKETLAKVQAAFLRRIDEGRGPFHNDTRAARDNQIALCTEEFKELERQRDLRFRALSVLGSSDPAAVASLKRKVLQVRTIMRWGKDPVRAAGYELAALERLGEPAALGDALLARLADWARVRPGPATALDLLAPESLMAARVLGMLAHVRLEKGKAAWDRMVRATRPGVGHLALRELGRVMGTVRQVKGLLLEEIVSSLGGAQALGARCAADMVATLPAEVAGKLSVEHIQGPFLIWNEKFKWWTQFGDGATVLRKANSSEAHLVLLAETKTYLPDRIFAQLFGRSDPRFAGVRMRYVHPTLGAQDIVLLPPPGTSAPTYLFSLPADIVQSAKDRMRAIANGTMYARRDVRVADIPITVRTLEDLSGELFEQAVKMIDEIWPR